MNNYDLKMSDTVSALKEYYDISALPETDSIKYFLILRYKAKASPRLIAEMARLREEGKKAFPAYMQKLIYHPNPFLEIIKK